MTLSTTQPTDQELNARWPYWIRLLAAEINALDEADDDFATTELSVSIGATSLVVGTNLLNRDFEIVLVSGGAATIDRITYGTQGQIKVLVFQNDNIDITDGNKANGEIYLNQVPAGTDLEAATDDVLALLNIGGDGAGTHGYWKELWRSISVK